MQNHYNIIFTCRICNQKKDASVCCHEIFGVICQECQKKYYTQLFNVAQKAATKEINKIKEDLENGKTETKS